jgi:hypothetical protein
MREPEGEPAGNPRELRKQLKKLSEAPKQMP